MFFCGCDVFFVDFRVRVFVRFLVRRDGDRWRDLARIKVTLCVQSVMINVLLDVNEEGTHERFVLLL